VNVTWYFVLESNFSKCLCECYMIFCFRAQLLEMFMWMLHGILFQSSTSQNVYLNVTWYFVLESNFSKCLSECYMIFCSREQLLEMFKWILHDILLQSATSGNVYVNVTWYFASERNFWKCLCECYMIFCFRGQLLEMIMWFCNFSKCLFECYMIFCNFWKCLFECYMIFCSREQLLKMFRWMLHDILF
jgi:hypothetical protein